MSRPTSSLSRDAHLHFSALRIEGGLLAADWLNRISQLAADHQAPADYHIPEGLALRDELSRAWRMAQPLWNAFQQGRAHPPGRKADPLALTERLLHDLFVRVLGCTDLHPVAALENRKNPSPETLLTRPTPGGLRFFVGAGKHLPLVVAPAGVGLDTSRKEFSDGKRRRSPFGVLQDHLDHASDALWGVCSDGLTLRLVRDNASLTRPAWIQLDLERIFTEQLQPDFAVLWLLLHASRFGVPEQPADQCPLESWRSAGQAQGIQARERLRGGFEEALAVLGQGFLLHPGNAALRQALHDGSLRPDAYFGQLLRLVYRLIFLLTVEERGLLHPSETPSEVRKRYAEGYALARLRERCVRPSAHDRFSDLWAGVRIVFRGLAEGEPRLGLPPLAGLFAADQCPHLDTSRLENRVLLMALFRLCWIRDGKGLSRVNWRDMGPDELGYVYEGLLEKVPVILDSGRRFTFVGEDASRGNARKTSGSYYTPDSLVQLLLDSALEPVIEQTLARHPTDGPDALLRLKVVDPACGSGHFLLAAGRRLAERLARLRTDGTPSATEYRRAMRQVVGSCLFGVDLNPLAVELCKVALWMEAVDPGLPLSFLDANVQHGNALLGTSWALMKKGIPDDAWTPLEGDDKKLTSSLKKRNRLEGALGQLAFGLSTTSRDLSSLQAAVVQLGDESLTARREKAARYQALLESSEYQQQKRVMDTWCAAFVWPKQSVGPLERVAPVQSVWQALNVGQKGDPLLLATVESLARDYAFFHWELAFPTVYQQGGWDVVLGNPPWERIKLQEQEFFASRSPEIAEAATASERKKRIQALPTHEPALWDAWRAASRQAEGQSHFVRSSGRYPLCGKGDVNTYALFAEHNRWLLGPEGRAGFIVPTGIATDDTTKEFFGALMKERQLCSLFDFENAVPLFPSVHRSFKFSLLTVARQPQHHGAELCFYAHNPDDVLSTERVYGLSTDELKLLNPNTLTCPTFRSKHDAEINLALYQRAGILWREQDPDGNPWGLRFMAMLHMANDSGLFRTREALEREGWRLQGNHFVKDEQRLLPLIEAKMVHHFDHRFGDYAEDSGGVVSEQSQRSGTFDMRAPSYTPLPRYWVPAHEVSERLADKWSRGWLLGWRDICRSTDQRTLIASLIPRAAVGHTTPLMFLSCSPVLVAALYANLCSLVLDYTARQKVGGTHMTYNYLKQLPVLAPSAYESEVPWSRGQRLVAWILPRVLELTYTAWDLKPFAEDCGELGAPFRWDPERRLTLRAELDAAFFLLYGLTRAEAEYVLNTFDALRRSEEKSLAEFRTRRLVLERYDALVSAQRSGRAYVSPLAAPERVAVVASSRGSHEGRWQ